MIYTTEVQHMCPVAKGAYHGPAPIPEAVSYTHLDVYKRQVSYIFLLCGANSLPM